MLYIINGGGNAEMVFSAPDIFTATEAARVYDRFYCGGQVFDGDTVRVFMPAIYAGYFKTRVLSKEFKADEPLLVRHFRSEDFDRHYACFDFTSGFSEDLEAVLEMLPTCAVATPVFH